MEQPKSTFLNLFEKVESLAGRLPGGLHKTVLNAVTPVKDLFLLQRPPRLVLVGDPTVGGAGLFNAIFGAPVAPFEPAGAGGGEEAHVPPTGWQNLTHAGRGVIQLLDARDAAENTTAAAPADVAHAALAALAPDLFLFVRDASASASADVTVGLSAQLDALESLLAYSDARHGEEHRPTILPLIVAGTEDGSPTDARLDAPRARLAAALGARPKLASRVVLPVRAVATFMRFRLDGTFDPDSDRRRHVHGLVDALTAELPDEAKLEMARLSGAQDAQRRIADTLVKSITAASGALGLQPIPLADMPFLLAFQTMMVSGIIYISGRELNAKLATKFLTAMGANVGLGLVLREGTRAVAKLVPGWGNVVSGGVAAAGTYAVGRAAIAFFIEGASIADAEKLLKRSGRPGRSVFHLIDRRRRK